MREELEGECSRSKAAAVDDDNPGKHGNDVVVRIEDLAEFMKGELASKCWSPPAYICTIFQVPEDIRNDDHGAYSPKVVSIGPFHRSRQNLQRMENIKWSYLENVLLRSLLRSKPGNDLQMYIDEMKEIAYEAQSSYSGNIQMGFEEFVKMMVLDGCFIIQLLLQLKSSFVKEDPIYSDRWTLPRVGYDMLLLENQLPFFILERLWELAGQSSSDLRRSVLTFFRNLLPEEHDLELPETDDVHHLLHLIHLSLQPTSPTKISKSMIKCSPQPSDTLSSPKNSPMKSSKFLQPASPTKISESMATRSSQHSGTLSSPKNSPSESPKSIQPTSPLSQSMSGTRMPPKRQPLAFIDPHDWPPIPSGLHQKQNDNSSGQGHQILPLSEHRPPPPPKTIPSVTELHEAGVKFQRKKARSFLDITFEQGLMEIPRLTISDSTNSLFRNFIAFEQCFPDCGSHFTSYCIFMDSLINTPRDVQLLSQSGIIEHVLGSDEEVALLFNKLCRGITWDYKNSYLAKVSEEVIKHTQKRWPKWRTKLVRDYFSNPWAILSLIAAIVILILTFLQTYFAVFGYFRPP